jgi:hypothetical protein
MNNKCGSCNLVNFPGAASCGRCGAELGAAVPADKKGSQLAVRAGVCMMVIIALLLGFYLSLIASAKSLTLQEKQTVRRAIAVLRDRGFGDQVMLLDNITAFRGTDNWLNASVAKENAYAATNFPFEIMTIYPDFFTYSADDTERAAILLHEAKHLAGKNEHDAYEFVWKNRKQLGWTKENYSFSPVWQNVRKQTRDNVPELFTCDKGDYNDCTE